jgi:uncharacterized RDD family membrane protein YckC
MTVAPSRHEQASVFLEGRAGRRRRRDIVTPEGVALTFELADFGERVTAFAIDVLFWFVAAVLIQILIVLTVTRIFQPEEQIGVAVGVSILLFAGFLVRNLYFIHFELAWQGSTPGKRIVGIRVVDRNGGPLKPMAVVARNLTREFEAFIPLGLLLSIGASTAIWERASLALWMLLFSLLPLFNRVRMRGGDLIAGTMVIAMPRRVLLGDLIETGRLYVFADRHLGAYGAFELQVLEDLLRRSGRSDARQLRREVCDRICAKIGWTDPVADADTERFLTDFYAAQRAWLERDQLYGRFRADKTSAAAAPG